MDSSFVSKYCKVRLVGGSVMAGIAAVLLFVFGMLAGKIFGDTSTYVKTEATVFDGDIKATTSGKTTYFNVIYNVEYVVDKMKYNGKITERFSSFAQAQAELDDAEGKHKQIYYDPSSPDKYSQSRATKSIVRWVSFGVSTLLFIYAIVAYTLRDNKTMCALTTFSNIARRR